MSKKLTTYIAALISMFFWGMSFIWTKKLLHTGYPVISIIFIRVTIAAILLVFTSKILGKLQKIQKADIKWFLLMAAFEPFFYFIGETYGIQITGSSTLASVMMSTAPIFSTLVAFYFYNERMSKQNLIGIGLSVIGVCLVIFHNSINEINAQLLGILLLFVAVISSTFYSVVIRKLTNYNSFTIVAYQNIIGAILFLPLFFTIDYNRFIKIPFSIQNTYPFVMLAAFASGIAFMLFVVVIKQLGVARANIFLTLVPVVTAILCVILGIESITIIQFVGICIVVAGLILSQLKVNTLKK